MHMPDTPAHYDPEELRRLLRAPRLAPVTAGLQQLEALGLLAWSPQVIQFLPQAQALRQELGQDGYKARQCVAGGRVAAPWIATVFGIAERTVQRAMQVLQGCGWLARLTIQPAHERPHGRYTVINLAWQRPGATGETRDTRTAAATTSPEEPAMASCHNLSPLRGPACRKLSPMAAHSLSITPENTESCDNDQVVFFQPFQEERQDPEP